MKKVCVILFVMFMVNILSVSSFEIYNGNVYPNRKNTDHSYKPLEEENIIFHSHLNKMYRKSEYEVIEEKRETKGYMQVLTFKYSETGLLEAFSVLDKRGSEEIKTELKYEYMDDKLLNVTRDGENIYFPKFNDEKQIIELKIVERNYQNNDVEYVFNFKYDYQNNLISICEGETTYIIDNKKLINIIENKSIRIREWEYNTSGYIIGSKYIRSEKRKHSTEYIYNGDDDIVTIEYKFLEDISDIEKNLNYKNIEEYFYYDESSNITKYSYSNDMNESYQDEYSFIYEYDRMGNIVKEIILYKNKPDINSELLTIKTYEYFNANHYRYELGLEDNGIIFVEIEKIMDN